MGSWVVAQVHRRVGGFNLGQIYNDFDCIEIKR